jgi:hypothetical protein
VFFLLRSSCSRDGRSTTPSRAGGGSGFTPGDAGTRPESVIRKTESGWAGDPVSSITAVQNRTDFASRYLKRRGLGVEDC